jgi:hypothetical protein
VAIFIANRETGDYAAEPVDELRSWKVVNWQAQRDVAPYRLYRTPMDALYAAIARAAAERTGWSIESN